MKTKFLDILAESISQDQKMMGVLKQVKTLELPDCWVGAGFVRNKAWALLHGRENEISLTDIDVVFYDSSIEDMSEHESQLHRKLEMLDSTLDWEVINQARTHLWHNREPYLNTTEAISEWVETATCIGVRLSGNNELEFTAPHGVYDLENLILRPVPSMKDLDVFKNRIEKKGWLSLWPKLKVELDVFDKI